MISWQKAIAWALSKSTARKFYDVFTSDILWIGLVLCFRCFNLCILLLCHASSQMVTLGIFLTSVTLVDVSSHMVTFSYGWSRLVTHCHAYRPFSVIVKLGQCQVEFGCSFHVVTHFLALSRIVTLCHVLWRVVTLGRCHVSHTSHIGLFSHAVSPRVTILSYIGLG
jgi:hypothetical protein